MPQQNLIFDDKKKFTDNADGERKKFPMKKKFKMDLGKKLTKLLRFKIESNIFPRYGFQYIVFSTKKLIYSSIFRVIFKALIFDDKM